jgi:UDP-N-acetylmuramyl pentapeptide phosphotransferase/UDP-N-acetylglucosamine-1-phosphate transferase
MWSLNLFNFMDGADGLAGGAAVIGFATYALAATLAGVPEFGLLNATLAAACLGFLWFNFHPARIFLGDVGAVPLGFLAGAFGLWGIRLGCWTASFALLVFLPFIVDATFTVLRRSASGERIWQAHREHCYQRLIRLGWSHRATALAYYALMTGCAGSALALLQLRPGFMWGMLALWLGAHAALYLLLDRYWIRHGRQRDNN